MNILDENVLAMSRSYRKTPIRGITTAASEKRDKQFTNRRLRGRLWSCRG